MRGARMYRYTVYRILLFTHPHTVSVCMLSVCVCAFACACVCACLCAPVCACGRGGCRWVCGCMPSFGIGGVRQV